MRLRIVVCQVGEEVAELVNASLVVKPTHTIEVRNALHCDVAELLDFERSVRGDNSGGTNLPRDVPHQLDGKILGLLIPADRVGFWPTIAKFVGTQERDNREVRHGARLSAEICPLPPSHPGGNGKRGPPSRG